MASVSLSDLIAKIRRITGRPSANQISDTSIVNYVNLFYEYDFPQELKAFDFKTLYTFTTQPDQDEYILSQTNRNLYKSFEPPVYCSGYQIGYYQNREHFYNLWPSITTQMDLAIGSGIAGPYTGTLNAVSILKGSVLISAVGPAGTTLIAQDNGAGTFIGDVVAGGTINYTTGAISLTFTGAIALGDVITAKWVQYNSARPQGVLFFNNTFIVRPVPDDAYVIQLQTYIKPFAVTAIIDVHEQYTTTDLTAQPLLEEYFQLLAYGSSLKIFADSLEMENYSMIHPIYKEQLSLVERRTLMQIKTQRVQTIFSDNLYTSGYRLPTY